MVYPACLPMKHKTDIEKDPLLRTAVFLRESQFQRLKALSEAAGSPIAELVRRAVSAYLEARKSEIPKGK